MRAGSKLTSTKRKELILDLCKAFATLRSYEEVADLLTDLLTAKEIETIAKRLQIADLLMQGKDYGSIREELKVGFSTIARVNTWLNISGQGFKTVLSRKVKQKGDPEKEIEERYDPYSWHNIRKRYSLYFWPQLLIEEFYKQASKKEKERIYEILNKLDLKSRRFRGEENKKLYEMFSEINVKK